MRQEKEQPVDIFSAQDERELNGVIDVRLIYKFQYYSFI